MEEKLNMRQKRKNKFDDGGPNKVDYYNLITGENYGDTMPEGMSRVRRFEDLTPQAQDEYMANRSTQLDDLVVYPRSGKGAKSTNMGSYYDTMNTLTEQNRKHAEEVAMQDALVRNSLNFDILRPILGAVNVVKNHLIPQKLGVLDLSNANFEQIKSPNKRYQYILANDFVERNSNNIRQVKDFYNTSDTLIGDRKIPLSQMPLYAGAENGHFKIDSLSRFNPHTTVFPVRSKNRPGGYIKIIPRSPYSKQYLNDLKEARRLADEKYPIPWYARFGFGTPTKEYMTTKLKYSNQVLDSLTTKHGSYNTEKNSNSWRGITTQGDTIPLAIPSVAKAFLYSPTTKKTIFTENITDQNNLQQINDYLKNNPSYIGIFDNGRYHHTTSNSTVYDYKYPFDSLDGMYIIGVTK